MVKWAFNSMEHKVFPVESQTTSANSMREEMKLSKLEEMESTSGLP